MNSEDHIRPTVRAVIRMGPRILVQVKRALSGKRYLTLPGGRQETGETMQQCLVRECIEEIGMRPEVGRLLHVADVFRVRTGGRRQLTEMLFSCTLPDDYEPQLGSSPDKRQIATIWADPAAMGAQFLPRYDTALLSDGAPVYLGSFFCEAP